MMPATADEPAPGTENRSGTRPAGDPPDPEATSPTAERQLRAHDNNRVYQAAGDQYIYHRHAPAPAAVSNTLPRDTAAFTGRDQELRTLLDTVAELADQARMIPVHAIDGMPGIGKSALAIHAGHLLGHRFPAGQFFIDLHAHSPGRGPVRPTDALDALLSADGVDPTQIPADLDSRAALWRGRMAGKKALLILDNAAGRWQVEPLLPGAAGCLVLITSRRRLTGLGARHGAVTLPLNTLSPDRAAALFASMAARPMTGTEADAVGELVRLCGFLPLAICLLAAKLRPERHWLVADLVRDLTLAKHRLAEMHAEDVAVAAAFDLSYRLLPAGRRRFFRRLSLHPGPDLDMYAAAALDGISPAGAQRQLDALYHDNLLDQPVRGRYRMHDLIGDYARTRADSDPAGDRNRALVRMLDHYQHGAQTANHHLSRPGHQQPPIPAGSLATLPGLHSRQQALAWMDAERNNLSACATLLSAGREHPRTIALAAAMATYLRIAGPWDLAISLHEAAVTAAGRTGDRRALASALYELGIIHCSTGDYGSATEALHRALELHQQLDQGREVADTLTQLASVRWRSGDHRGAARDLKRALGLYEDQRNLYGQANALNELGVVQHMADDHPTAVHTQRRALAIHIDLDDPQGHADTLNRFGAGQRLTGEYPPAIEAHERALAIYRELGNRFGQARALNFLSAALIETGEYAAAEHVLTRALEIHRDLGYRQGQANALNYLGIVHRHTGDYAAAEQALARALALYRALGSRPGQADALNQVGALRRLTGDRQAAARAHDEALTIFRQIGDRLGQAEVLNGVGQLLLADDRPAQALDRHRQALQLARRAQNPRAEAHSIEGIGRCALRLGNRAEAAEKLGQAQGIYQRIGALRAARTAAELAAGTTTDGRRRGCVGRPEPWSTPHGCDVPAAPGGHE
ncbi:tetratricopeptide repeat protein [Micromonospora sp. NBC_01699]|uniref:ATP-binding protein n=1 Tax=Micromonospora sp. NBC_01699 TaxID=2975984 RepID=UPI002E284999|nr:tetratricopeptide repeat protein [Micromonospora sp. NBC_01699]